MTLIKKKSRHSHTAPSQPPARAKLRVTVLKTDQVRCGTTSLLAEWAPMIARLPGRQRHANALYAAR